MGAALVKEVASKAGEQAGDGIHYSCSNVNLGIRIFSGANPKEGN